MNFEKAKRNYVNRFTMDHVPTWALTPANNGKYYAPQYISDKEWYDNTFFPPHKLCYKSDCYSTNQTWPIGQWLDKPYSKEPKK
ncbi:MAG: hypothetical protein UU59_C0051G0006 [candidate division WWE3 bacterium GW2011_GWE1_41_27]|uniref:Uncharacterized protein n=1 Tax=candidate division WWE3 bacterium GW2011_GWE1_41_27 TaxID=1619131 RepID=A0A0G0Y771_UNCKA|nr:MAG: hypothetical protein UU59_C0051G0006 [candidate division WWE3 bacterium GW2011_GWE1_41_27]